MTTLLRANTELVAVAWLAGATGLSSSMVATTLPTDATTWAATGFVTVRTSGGAPAVDTPLRRPVVTVDTWAVNPTSAKPRWGLANYLAEVIARACDPLSDVERMAIQRPLVLPANYPAAVVKSAWIVSEPRRAYGDPGNYGHYVLDMALRWVDLS